MTALPLSYLKENNNFLTPEAKRRRGYEFEKYLFDKFKSESLRPKSPYKATGEQIDSGIYLDGRWYLIEAKWHEKPLPVSAVYAFRGKVDGKLAGTCGFFISWSGYSEECADALSMGKELNVILCDAADVELAESIGWREVLLEKLMFASLYGLVNAPPSTRRAIADQEEKFHNIEVFVEGHTDAAILNSFLRQMDVENFIVVTAGGKQNAIHLSSTLPKLPNCLRLLILDSDGNFEQEDELKGLPLIDANIAIEPQIEYLLFPNSENPKREFRKHALEKTPDLLDAAVDAALKKDSQGFASKLRAAIRRLSKTKKS